MITKADALHSLCPTARFDWVGDEYSGLTWLDSSQTKPTESEIDAEVARLQAAEPARVAGEKRRAAYAAEADPLFFKAQRGEATLAEWQAKVAEIKARYPKE